MVLHLLISQYDYQHFPVIGNVLGYRVYGEFSYRYQRAMATGSVFGGNQIALKRK